ncbi:hypothetical protein BC941DRAFT_504397 [Chlamydoabsidia padenii]|nr:hypothetical protein BC941DRAFT_504397 [Chlamydoabsidia padenii]
MTSLATKYIESKARKYARGRAAELLNPTLKYVNDPEIIALQQEELAKANKGRSWWKGARQHHLQPDIILNERDRQVLRSVKWRAQYLDKGWECCYFSFGFDFLIGLLPAIGDVIGLLLGLELINVARQADLPNHIQIAMLTNVLIDFLVGLVPIIGDILDSLVKSNWRNAVILEDYLMIRRRDEIRAERGLPKRQDDDVLKPLPQQRYRGDQSTRHTSSPE